MIGFFRRRAGSAAAGIVQKMEAEPIVNEG
jgi:hypothetical protein